MWEKDKANETVVYRKQLTFSQITMQLTKVGTDYHIAVWGGEKPHIDCTVLVLIHRMCIQSKESCQFSCSREAGISVPWRSGPRNWAGRSRDDHCPLLHEDSCRNCIRLQ